MTSLALTATRQSYFTSTCFTVSMPWDDYELSVGKKVWNQLKMACFTNNFTNNFQRFLKTLRKITQKFRVDLCKQAFHFYGDLAVFI